jgi:dolichyl-phosphate-mannose--protein O-mannosyl transferase
MPVDMLTPLSGSLQQLASEVSPAVVQIEVSGYGPADQGDRKDAARLHAVDKYNSSRKSSCKLQ